MLVLNLAILFEVGVCARSSSWLCRVVVLVIGHCVLKGSPDADSVKYCLRSNPAQVSENFVFNSGLACNYFCCFTRVGNSRLNVRASG